MTPQYHQPPIDLFGEVVITEDDIHAWVEAVSPVHYTERLLDWYVERWDVASKVRAFKLSGEFDAIISRPRTIYHVRLALSQIR